MINETTRTLVEILPSVEDLRQTDRVTLPRPPARWATPLPMASATPCCASSLMTSQWKPTATTVVKQYSYTPRQWILVLHNNWRLTLICDLDFQFPAIYDAMAHKHAKNEGQWSVRSKPWAERDGWTDGRSDRRARSIANLVRKHANLIAVVVWRSVIHSVKL